MLKAIKFMTPSRACNIGLYLTSVDKLAVVNTFPDEKHSESKTVCSLQKTTWASRVSRRRTSRRRHLSPATRWTLKPRISSPHTCWDRLTQPTTATSVQSIITTTTRTTTPDFRTATRSTKWRHRRPRTFISIIRAFMATKYGRSSTYRDERASEEENIFSR